MFEWLQLLFQPAAEPSIAQSVLVVCLTISFGMLLGKLSVRRVSLGMAGVLFVGIGMGHLGYRLHAQTLLFLRDAGLILFVYAIGLQVGPSFFASLRREGLRFNLLAAGGVLVGALVAAAVMAFSGLGADNMVGIMSGAVTNTPGLGAAQSVLGDLAKAHPEAHFNNPASGYAIAYPVGAVGVVVVLLLFKRIFRIDTAVELERFEAESLRKYPRPENRRCRVVNPAVVGMTVSAVEALVGGEGVIITRIKHSGDQTVHTPAPDTVLEERDVVMVVGLPDDVHRAAVLLGRESSDTLISEEKETVTRHFFVTRRGAAQLTLAQLNLEGRHGAKVSRVYRAGLEFLAAPHFVLHYGDRVRVVGPPEAMPEIQRLLGDSVKRLQEPELLPIFIGIVLGVVLGSIPVGFPGLPVPVRLGLAAGPLLVAIVISRFGGIGALHSFLNQSAALFMRDFGLCLFFAAVGIGAGKDFYRTFVDYGGWWWVLFGAIITFIPPLTMVIVGRKFLKINYLQLAGILGGAHTSPTSLAFSTAYFNSDIPAQAYAAVFPLATLLRILLAQLFVLYFL